MPIPTLSFLLSEPLLMSCFSPYILPTLWALTCASVIHWTVFFHDGACTLNKTSLKDQASQGGCPENRSHKPRVVHIRHGRNGEGRTGWRRKTWKIRQHRLKRKKHFPTLLNFFNHMDYSVRISSIIKGGHEIYTCFIRLGHGNYFTSL